MSARTEAQSRAATPAIPVDLSTSVAGLRLGSPLMVASGCGGAGPELAPFADLAALGAFVTPTVTRDRRLDGGPGRLFETPSGRLRTAALPGPGVDGFLATDLPWLLRHRVKSVVSIAGRTLEELAELTRRVGETPGVAAIELNLAGCGPEGGPGWMDVTSAGRALAVVRRDAAPGVPVLAKIAGGSGDLATLARAAARSGADGLVVAGVTPGLLLDRTSLRPRLTAGTGELSGPAMLPVTLQAVWTVRDALPEIGIAAVGGICGVADVMAVLAVGADAVQLGGVLLADPHTPDRIAADLSDALAASGFASVRSLVGHARRAAPIAAVDQSSVAAATDPDPTRTTDIEEPAPWKT